MKIETQKILRNPVARQAYYEELQRRRSGKQETGDGSQEPGRKNENGKPKTDNSDGHAADLLASLRATAEPAPSEDEWEVRKQRREALERETLMIELMLRAARERLREIGIKPLGQ